MQPKHGKRDITHLTAGLLLIVVAVAVSFITYLFVMNYVGSTIKKSGKAIEIQTMNIADGNLTVYVQNVGKETVTLDPTNCIYTNGEPKTATITKTTLTPGDTTTITVDGFTSQPKTITVKVTTTDGTTTEATLQ